MFSRVGTEKSTGWQEMWLGPVQSITVGKLCTLALESLGKYLIPHHYSAALKKKKNSK